MAEYFEFHVNKRCSSTAASYIERRCDQRFGGPGSMYDPRDQTRILQLFKDTIGASINLVFKDKSCRSDDNFLSRFLYATKFKCEAAMELLIHYLTFKEHNRLLLQSISIFDGNIQLALRDGNPAVLKERDRRGRKVITFATANWDPCQYNLEDVFRAFLLTLDKLLENVQNQALGFVVVVDWTNFTFKQSTYLSPKILKLMIEGLQNCMPLKIKGIHFIAQPWYVDIALAVIKPFLKEKTKRRIIIHGSNLTTLHNLINKDILPPDLGGEGPSINTLDWYHYLLESSQNSEAPKSYRLIATTVYTKTPTLRKAEPTARIIDNANYDQFIS